MQRSRWRIWGAVVMLLLGLALPFVSLPFTGADASPAVEIGSLPPLVARSQRISSVDPQRHLSLSINMSLRDQGGLRQYVQALYTPGSYLYHRYLRPAEFARLYGPTERDVASVTNYLHSQDLQVTRAIPGQQVIDFNGTVAQVERAFGVQINMYRARNGRTFYANSSAPRVPLALRSLITNINGLSDAAVRGRPPLPPRPVQNGRSPRVVNCPGPGNSSAQYLLPSQFATAYNFTSAYSSGLHGEGQSIALFELDSYTASDISNYQACYDSNAPTRINTQLIDGGAGPQGAGALEVELDMDAVLGMLPGLMNLFVYEAPNTDTGYNDEWAQILADNIPVVSTSWGLCEPNMSGTNITAEQQFFIQAAAQGQTLLAASGDSGAFDCGDGTLAVDDPASNPYMTGVGGTHLAVNSNNSYNSESVWSGTPGASNASGGGVSALWSMPAYQSGPGVISTYSSGSPCRAGSGQNCREVPDLSLNADPAIGYIVYCTVSAAGCSTQTPFVSVGGTSAAAPMWAAVVALANQYALAHGGYNLGFLNPAIYTLLGTNVLYARAFHDVTSGNNLNYPATAGYDMATGIGTPNVYGFIQAIVSLPGQRNVPGNTRWYFAEGHVGDNFQEYLTLQNPSVSSAAHVVVTYLLRGKPSVSQSLMLAVSSRSTVNVNDVLRVPGNARPGQDVSLYITSDLPVVAERPIYFVFYFGNTPGGSDLLGQTQPGMHFTFANGETLAGYSTYITVLNPPGQQTATITATYYSGGAAIGQSTMSVPAGQRNTLMANDTLGAGKQFLIQVDSTQPVVVERPMYFHAAVAGVASAVMGGSSVQGVTPKTTWYYAAGSTGGNQSQAQENLILANSDVNSSGSAANVTITYAFVNGATQNVNVSVPAKSQLVENVNNDVGAGTIVAIKVSVTNGIPIVSERQQFFNTPSLVPDPTGVEVIGLTPGVQGAPTVYSFAEGHLGNNFNEVFTLFNPNNAAISVAVTYFVTRGGVQSLAQQTIYLSAMSVQQVFSNTLLNVPGNSSGTIPVDTSIVVQSLPTNGGTGPTLPVIAERSLYFNYFGSMPGSTSAIGYSGG